MFNNIIYFILVLLMFNMSLSGRKPEEPFFYHLGLIFSSWLVFAAYCRSMFRRLRILYEGRVSDGTLAGLYQRLSLRLSIAAICLFALDVYLFHLKYWLRRIPGVENFSVLEGALAISLFIFYLVTIWVFAYEIHERAFQTAISRPAFILTNIRINIPILFPWFSLSLLYDLILWSPWTLPKNWLNKPLGQMVFFAAFLMMLMVFMPHLIQRWWGCKPFESSEKVSELKAFLKEKRFHYRGILSWPIFQGRMMTAGIMGIVPRYRYILVTETLMDVLNVEELKAVMAHEMGHAKYRHLLFYVFFFLGYMVISFGLFDLFFYLFAAQPMFMRIMEGGESLGAEIFYFSLSLPILLTMLVYFRYVMGFFMRNFERQADLYSAATMGTPAPTVNALEKIAFLSGKIRDLPSWHHFSIKERVDYLWRTTKEPGLTRRHHRYLAGCLGLYLVCIVGVGYFLNFSHMKQTLSNRLIQKMIKQQLVKEPQNIDLYLNLALLFHHMEKYQEAIDAYERIIELDEKQATAYNNLAWILVTAPDEGLRDPEKGLALGMRAVELERNAQFLDTLAEAYYVNGAFDKAIDLIQEALAMAKENRSYYREQLAKFRTAKEGG